MFESIDNESTVSFLYDQGLKTQNPFLAIPALNELIRRGYFDMIRGTLFNYLAKNADFKVGSAFSKVLAECLMTIGDREPDLSKAGYMLDKHYPVNEIVPRHFLSHLDQLFN
ncbi:hypothetical protein IKF34_02170 [Candidatus Saccharibacteria bacterium]|nr:hypothetical protein [Candidatus Saccharibacteria bacterium]